MSYSNKYINLNYVDIKYSKYELSRRINQLIKEDRQKINKRVKVAQSSNALNNRKTFFIHQDWLHFIVPKERKSKNDTKTYFVTVRALNSDYISQRFYYDFINDFAKLKPRKKIEYVIPSADAHLHFIIDISKNELNKTLKKLIRTYKYAVLQYQNLKITTKQKDFFDKKYYNNVPIYIVQVDDVEKVKKYMSLQGITKKIN